MLPKVNLLLISALLGATIQPIQSFPVGELAQANDCYNSTSVFEYDLCKRSIAGNLLPRGKFRSGGGRDRGKGDSGSSRDRYDAPNTEPEAPGRNYGKSGNHFGSGGGRKQEVEYDADFSEEQYYGMVNRGRRDYDAHLTRLRNRDPDTDFSVWDNRKPEYEKPPTAEWRKADELYFSTGTSPTEEIFSQSLGRTFQDLGIKSSTAHWRARGNGEFDADPPEGRQIEVATVKEYEAFVIGNMDKGPKNKDNERFYDYPFSQELYENMSDMDVKRPKYVIHDDVQEVGTKPLIHHIHKKYDAVGSKRDFGPEDEEFYAYAGSRNGITTGRMISDNSEKIRRKLNRVHSWDELEFIQTDSSTGEEKNRKKKKMLAFEYVDYE